MLRRRNSAPVLETERLPGLLLCAEPCVGLETAKNGPIYDVAWSPNSSQFCVVFGFMPAKATIYNLNCDPVFDFGTGPRNAVYYR